MNAITISNALLRTIFILVGITAGIYLLYSISTILLYILIAFLVSFIAEPIIVFLQKRAGIKSLLAISLSLLLLLTTAVGILLLFIPLILTQSKKLALLDINSLKENYLLFVDSIDNWLKSYKINYTEYIDIQKILDSLNLNFISDVINSIIGSIGNFAMALFSIFFIAFFLMKDQKLVTKNIRYLLPKNQKWRLIVSLIKIKNMLGKYATGLILQLFLVFIMYLIVLLIFKVENAFIIAFLGALLNIIPYVGPIIAAIMTAFLTMLSNINQDFNTVIAPTTLYVLIGYCIVQLIDNNISQPIIASKSTNSHPLEIFIVLLISGTLLGITGMIIAVPLYTSIKVVLKEFFPKNKFIQVITANLK